MPGNSSTQNTIIASRTSLVKSGSRRMYDRTLAGLNGNGGNAAGVVVMIFSVFFSVFIRFVTIFEQWQFLR